MSTSTVKGLFPFRLGCTSYVYPEDIAPNVEKMALLVDDVEIILFESRETSNMPGAQTIETLRAVAEKSRTTYTIHFPIDRMAGSKDRQEREDMFQKIGAIVALTQPLCPYGYILHLEGVGPASSMHERKQWHAACTDFCEKIVAIPGLEPRTVCIENLFYPSEWHRDLVERFGFSLCCDIGHLWLTEKNWEALFYQWLSRTRIIHLHGVGKGEDHISLKKSDRENVVAALQIIKDYGYCHVISCEVFNENDTFESIELVRELWQKLL